MEFALNLIGIAVIFVLCWLLSYQKKAINWKLIGKALVIQLLLAIFIVKVPIGNQLIALLSDGVTMVVSCGKDGVSFVFGALADTSQMFVFCVATLANIIFVSALVECLYYLGILGFTVKFLGNIIKKIIGSTEVESFIATANMFLGQTSSPVLISKYISRMTDSEILVILVAGMGSMDVAVLTAYAGMGVPMEYLLMASIMVPISSILVAKIILPEVEVAANVQNLEIDGKGSNSNVIEAIINGGMIGLKVVVGISVGLISIIGMVSLINMILGVFGINLEMIFGYVFAPFGYLMGFTAENAIREGVLLGQKLALNEFIAFGTLGEYIATLDPRTAMMISISLAGFANLSSTGICIGGVGALCPEKKGVLSRLVFRAMVGGMLVSILSAMLCGLVALF